jgi:hypothetical protein
MKSHDGLLFSNNKLHSGSVGFVEQRAPPQYYTYLCIHEGYKDFE